MRKLLIVCLVGPLSLNSCMQDGVVFSTNAVSHTPSHSSPTPTLNTPQAADEPIYHPPTIDDEPIFDNQPSQPDEPAWKTALKEKIKTYLLQAIEIAIDEVAIGFVPPGLRGLVKKFSLKLLKGVVNGLVNVVFKLFDQKVHRMEYATFSKIPDSEIKRITDEILEEELYPILEDVVREAHLMAIGYR